MMRRGEQGSTIVETALSIGVLLTLLFGVIEVCLAVYSYHVVSEAAREGTRYAIVRGSTSALNCPSNPAAACPAATSDIQNYVASIGLLNIAPSDVSVAWSAYPAGATCTPSPTCNDPGDMVQVTVAYPFTLSIPFVPQEAITLSSTSAMVISQ